MAVLTDESCAPCRADSPAATAQEKSDWMKAIPEWRVTEDGGIPTLERSFEFDDFKGALDFTVKIGAEAEKQDHHPSVLVEWGKATIRWSTHKIRDLHKNDFVMAAKTDALFKNL